MTMAAGVGTMVFAEPAFAPQKMCSCSSGSSQIFKEQTCSFSGEQKPAQHRANTFVPAPAAIVIFGQSCCEGNLVLHFVQHKTDQALTAQAR